MLEFLFGKKGEKAQGPATQDFYINKQNKNGLTALHKAVKKSNADLVLSLISDQKTDLNVVDKSGNTALHYAVYDLTIASLLIDKCPALDIQNCLGETPLHLAVKNRNEKLTDLLLHYFANPNLADVKVTTHDFSGSTSSFGSYYETGLNTPLHYACSLKELSSRIIHSLIKNSADINAQNMHGETPFYLLLKNPEIEKLDPGLLTHLLREGDKKIIADSGSTVFHAAASNPKLTQSTFLSLLESVKVKESLETLDSKGNSPLVCAAISGNTDVIRCLVQAGVDLGTEQGELAVKKAMLNNQSDALTTLIQLGVNPNVHVYPDEYKCGKLSSSLYSSGRDGKDKTKMLQAGDTPLHFAVKTNNHVLAEACLRDPSTVNAINDFGKSPAFIAVKVLSPEMAHRLWLANPCIEQEHPCKNNGTVTLMMQAAARGFASQEQLDNFFKDKDYKLTPVQEQIKKRNEAKYGVCEKGAKTLSVVGIMKAPASVDVREVEKTVFKMK